jgi:Tol biopolymer transport system component
VPFGLIYQSAGGLWHVNADGEPMRILELDGASPYTRPAVSPDGTQVLYTHEDVVWLADIASGERRNLTGEVDRSECCAQWALGEPDVILFSSWPLGETGMDFGYPTLARLGDAHREQASAYRVIEDAARSYALPALSPDGRAVAYDRAGQAWLYREDTDAEPLDRTAYSLAGGSEWRMVSPAWSPDGGRLAWVVNDCSAGPCQSNVGVFDLKGRTAQRLHPHRPAGMGGWPAAPIWSPDGRWLAFTAWAEEPAESGLWVVRVDGQGEEEHHLETGRGRGSPEAVWSPDGAWLAIGDSAQGEGPKRFYLADAGDWGLQPLDLPADATLVAWVSPRP